MSLDPYEYRYLFPALKGHIIMNHAATPPHATVVREAMREFAEDDTVPEEERVRKWVERREKGLKLLANLINASSEEVAFTSSCVQGMLFVATGIDWRKGDNVVTTEAEYPSNMTPWLLLKRLGVETRIVPMPDGRVSLERLESMVDERTHLVTVSWVYALRGFRNDLSAIGKICREKGVYFAADVTQGAGAMVLDAKNTPIDFLASAGYKWLLGPCGSGFFYCRREVIPELIPAMTGYFGTVQRRDEATGALEIEAAPDSRRFTFGFDNRGNPAVYGLTAGIELLLSVGVDRIEQHILNITQHLIDGLIERGYDVPTVVLRVGYVLTLESLVNSILAFFQATHTIRIHRRYHTWR